jgi:hypothetical protein
MKDLLPLPNNINNNINKNNNALSRHLRDANMKFRKSYLEGYKTRIKCEVDFLPRLKPNNTVVAKIII